MARLWCWGWGHLSGTLIAQRDLGRHHVLVFVCPRCQRSYTVEYWDPR